MSSEEPSTFRSELLYAALVQTATGERLFRYARWAYENGHDGGAVHEAACELEASGLACVNPLMRTLVLTDDGRVAAAKERPEA